MEWLSLLDVQKLSIVHVFQVILAGMLWTALSWVWWHRRSRAIFGLWSSIGLFALSSLGFVVVYLRAMLRDVPLPLPGAIFALLQGMRVIASTLFLTVVCAYHPAGWIVGAGSIILLAMVIDGALFSTAPFVAFAGILLTGFLWIQLGRASLPGSSGRVRRLLHILAGLFTVDYVCSAVASLQASAEWFLVAALVFWGVLGGIALYLDLVTDDFMVKFFIRLNTVFIILAMGLMFIIAELQWRQFLRTVYERNSYSGELIRGYILTGLYQGRSLRTILDDPKVIRQSVAAFGKVPELRIIRLVLGPYRMEFHWQPDRTIERRIVRQASSSVQTDRNVSDDVPVHLTHRWVSIAWPIRGPRAIGRLEFLELPHHFNRRVGKYLFIIFSMFTTSVVLAGIFIGVILWHMQRRIRRQQREILETQQQLIYATRLAFLGELASGIAHELNTPAGVIAARSEYVRARLEDCLRARRRVAAVCRECAQDLDTIQRQAMRIGRFVRNLLELARPQPMQCTRLDLVRVIHQSLELFRAQFRMHQIRVHYTGPKICVIEGDPARLEQVLTNLIKNAIDAMPHGGELRIAVDCTDAHVRVTIADTGIGMSPETLARIWDPFFSTKSRGIGLGLSIVRNIVQSHGGRIAVHSEVGRGTVFEITLARRMRPPQASPAWRAAGGG